jgi:4-hydroxybenzoate polyprenyltransferase
MKLLTLFRPVNLLLIVLTQSLVAFRFLPNFYTNWWIWTITTLLVAAAGYIINDIFDVEIDRINKPHKSIVAVLISTQQAYWLYYSLNLLAFIIGILTNTQLFIELLLIASVLYSYARWFKKMPLLGNLFVAFLSAYSVIFPLRSTNIFVWNHQLEFFCFFAFAVSLFREIVKTIEDIAGDRAGNCKTLPILIGENNTKFILYFLIIVMFCFLGNTFFHNENVIFRVYYTSIGVFLCWLVDGTFHAQNKSTYHQISNLTKLLMLLGIVGLLL